MKIGLVCRHYSANKGGLEAYTLNLSRELTSRGHEVHVFCNTGDEKPGILLHKVPVFPFSSPGKNLSFALMAPAIISRFDFDVVQSMERIWSQDIFRASDGINPVQMQQRYTNPLWRRFKAACPRRLALSMLERRIFQKGGTKRVMTNSVLVKKQIMEHYHVPEEKIAVIYNSVDTDRYNLSTKISFRNIVREEHDIGSDDNLILFAGNDFQRKGLSMLIEALARIKDPTIKLIVAGSDAPEPYKRLASKGGIGENVLFIGHHKNPEKLYGSADIFVLPTRYDAFANVCLEAMACGTPVITTETNGASEIIEEGKEGFVIKTREPHELMRRIQDGLKPGSNQAMGIKASQKAAKFSVDTHMTSILSLYDRICEERTL